MREHKLKVGVSGVRGVVGEFLTPLLAADFAQAFGAYVGRGRVVLGRDTRFTGPTIEHAVACGLMAAATQAPEFLEPAQMAEFPQGRVDGIELRSQPLTGPQVRNQRQRTGTRGHKHGQHLRPGR